MSPHLLVVEDEEGLRDGLRRNFEFEGYRVSTAADGVSGLESALSLKPDVVILDIMLPKMNGYEVCRRLRDAGFDPPVIMLTVRRGEVDRVRGLEIGADDYVLKPFSVQELSARVKALLRRSRPHSPEQDSLMLGEVKIDLVRQEAVHRNRAVRLSFREFEVLRCLAARIGQVVSREELLEQALGYSSSTTSRAVDNLIVSLRKKIEIDPRAPRHILTAHGMGYKLVE